MTQRRQREILRGGAHTLRAHSHSYDDNEEDGTLPTVVYRIPFLHPTDNPQTVARRRAQHGVRGIQHAWAISGTLLSTANIARRGSYYTMSCLWAGLLLRKHPQETAPGFSTLARRSTHTAGNSLELGGDAEVDAVSNTQRQSLQRWTRFSACERAVSIGRWLRHTWSAVYL